MAQKFMDEHSATISRDQDSPDDDRVLGKQNSYLLPTCATAPLPDHVRRENFELGFPADGYNYLVHLRDTKVGLFPVDAMVRSFCFIAFFFTCLNGQTNQDLYSILVWFKKRRC